MFTCFLGWNSACHPQVLINVQSVTLMLAARDVTCLDLVVLIGGMPGRNQRRLEAITCTYSGMQLAILSDNVSGNSSHFASDLV